eukprot:6818766-Pyramimonas_sp.AAC.1
MARGPSAPATANGAAAPTYMSAGTMAALESAMHSSLGPECIASDSTDSTVSTSISDNVPRAV